MTTRDELVAHTPERVWLRVCGGGITMPSGKSYMTLVGDNRPQDRHTEYVRADLASRQEVSVEDLTKFIREEYERPGSWSDFSRALLAKYSITKREG